MPARVNPAEVVKDAKDGYDVLKDIMTYAEQGDYDAIPEDDVNQRFKWFGAYRQKPNTGHFMLRIKIPGGQLTPHQLKVLAELVDKYARGFGDITTRQTIQMHWLTIADLKPIFETLWDLGMTSQFACGDVPRNIVCCPLAGVIEDEIIDASQHARDIEQAFVDGGKDFSNLPRKFKPSIGGCKLHCHQPQINCYGLYGVKRDNGEAGYGLVVGGGLSSTPHFAQPLRVFVKPEQVVEVSKAICTLFRDQGYREKRTRSRLKFLVADKGWEWTRTEIEKILGYELEHDDSIQNPPTIHTDHIGTGKQKDGNYYVGVPISRGRWTAKNMADIAEIADQYGVGEKRIRTTSKQNVILLDIPEAHLATDKSLGAAIQKLVDGKVDALVADRETCAFAVLRHPDAGLLDTDVTFTVEPMGIAVPLDEPRLANLVQTYLNALADRGMLKKATEFWLKDPSWVKDLR